MESKIVAFTYGAMTVDAVLAMAAQNNFADIVIAARDKDGTYSCMGSPGELRDVHWLLAQAMQIILKAGQ